MLKVEYIYIVINVYAPRLCVRQPNSHINPMQSRRQRKGEETTTAKCAHDRQRYTPLLHILKSIQITLHRSDLVWMIERNNIAD